MVNICHSPLLLCIRQPLSNAQTLLGDYAALLGGLQNPIKWYKTKKKSPSILSNTIYKLQVKS